MKKLLLTLAGLFVAALAFSQSLDGTWKGIVNMGEQKDSADVSVKISLDGEETMVIEGTSCTKTEKAVLTIAASSEGEDLKWGATFIGKVSGTLVQEGDVLTFTPVKKPKPEVKVEVENIPMVLKLALVNPIKSGMAKDLKEPSQSRIISLSDQELVLEDVLTEKEIKKGEKPERVTYKKQ